MASINKVILVGNVGKDPEVITLDNGTKLAKFPLATSESYTDKSGQRVENTTWHNIVVWRNQAEIVEKYVKKGRQLYIEGKIKTRSYTDKDNATRYITEIEVDNFIMLGRRDDFEDDSSVQNQSGNSTQQNKPDLNNEPAINSDFESSLEEDDLPF
jgi:single-strand DNA-binding protein